MNEDEAEAVAYLTPDSPMDCVRQWAQVAGQRQPGRAWLLHDRDVWVANPWYRGAPVPHPEMGEEG
jgi:hypothetical protein